MKETAFKISIKDIDVQTETFEDSNIERMHLQLKAKLEVIFDGQILCSDFSKKIPINNIELIKHIRENSNQILISVG